VTVPPARPGWIGPVVGLAVGLLAGRLVSAALQRPATGIGVEAVVLAAVAMIAAAAWFRLRRVAKPRAQVPVAPVPDAREPAALDTDLDRGVRDIRRTDRGFDAARFAGYAGMTFRDVQSARMARDAGGLRDRLTSAMYVELDARCDGLRTSGRSARVAEVDVSPEVTEAWQDGNRDYVTAYVAGSMLSHTVDDATGKVVDGRPATPMPVQAFLTFTRPAGLNFWMLSIIQGE
jgi:predicted lipid-binding transport protein (Tim44 family)